MMVSRSHQRAWNATFAGCSAVVLYLSGCAEVEERYGPRQVRAPEPVTGGLVGAPSAEPIKPIGARSVAAGRPLTRPVVVTSGAGAYNPLVRNPDPGGAEDLVSLNFEAAEIREVVEIVLGETLGLNYIFDERVSGSVTARTTQPVSRSAVLTVLENVLALNGAALVPSPGGYAVVPLEEAGTLAKVVVTPSTRGPRAGIGAYVIPLRAASVVSVSEILETIVSPDNALVADPARNLLIYTGPAGEAQAIADLVSVLDVDVLSGKQLGLFPVKVSRAADVAAEVELLYADPSLGDGQVRFLPIERLNAILVVAARPRQMDQVGFWIEQLDRAAGGAGRQVYVYHARNGRAAELANVLGQVFLGNEPGTAAEPAAVAPGLAPVAIFRPDRSAADDQVGGPLASASPFASAGGGAEAARGLRIVADERNNAVVVIGTEEEFRLVEATLRQIDILPLQVLIEATIAEVTLNDGLEYGLQWAFANGNVRGNLTNNTFGRVSPSFPGFNFIFDTSDVRLVLSALAEVTDVNVISSPQLMVLDNQPARLQVGDQVPVQTGETITDGGAQFNTIEYIDTGVILEVTPRVNASGLVTLEINQEVSDAVVTRTSGLNSPTIQQRSIRSIVSIQSGETIALGGLIRERAEAGESGLPILKDIPILGAAFGTRTQDFARTELLVLITPRVIRGPGEARAVTEELRRRLTRLEGVLGGAAARPAQ